MQRLRWAARLTLLGLLAIGPRRAAAEAPELQLSGRLQTDVRLRPQRLQSGAFFDRRSLSSGVSRNRNLFKLRLSSEIGQVAAVADLDFVYLGMLREVETFDDLRCRGRIDPYFLRANAAYVQVHDFLTSGLDLRLGQQLVNWGKGDQFNPTNNLNANDLSDPLQFGQQLANSMLRLDYSPQGTWTLSAVLVPVFTPALLPLSAPLALGNTRRIPIEDAPLRRRLVTQQNAVQNATGLFARVARTRVELPPPQFDNVQFALRSAFSIYRQDAALSYYYGRSDMPLPVQQTTTPTPGAQCNPQDPTDCIAGTLETEVVLRYPRMQVVGINIAGELPLLGFLPSEPPPFGYHVEMALISPQRTTLRILQNAGAGLPAGEYAYGGDGSPPAVVGGKPFLKWNIGLDYTLLQRFYLNVQWLHGFIDEFGAGDQMDPTTVAVQSTVQSVGCDNPERCADELVRRRLGDYVVFGTEAKWLAGALLTRLFVVTDLTGLIQQRFEPRLGRRVDLHHSPFSRLAGAAVIFPEVTYNVGDGLDLSVGALANLGSLTSKFGDPAVGGSEIWTRARYSY